MHEIEAAKEGKRMIEKAIKNIIAEYEREHGVKVTGLEYTRSSASISNGCKVVLNHRIELTVML